ncbi:tRNA lysidine(34) synthetase TilS [Deinococcus aquiradiocola]|nr:tRNA lysidine(34) synthetase TilS [Deinococcus aquiradiocola]
MVAVSGGADSVALLRALVAVGARVHVGHFDHAFRPESAQDAAFVGALAEWLGVPCFSERVDVRAVAARRGWGLEEAARRLRYSFLTRAARRAGVGTLLTAHTRDDQVETVLWQALRGEAVLNGMPAVRGPLERPWLTVARADLRRYLQGLGQEWREDGSNLDTRFTRNWLRHEVLPLLRARFPGVDASLLRLSVMQAEDDDALRALAAALQPHTPLARQPLAVLRRHVRAALGPRAVHAGQVAALAGALRSGGTAHLTLPGDVPVSVTGGRLVLGEGAPASRPAPEFPLPSGWVRRAPQAGDRVRLPGGTRKLSDVLTDLKVPRRERPHLHVVALPGEPGALAWVGLPLPNRPLWAVGAATLAGQPDRPDPDVTAMGEALRLARQAAQAGEVPVGAVVLHRGEVVAGAANRSRELGDLTSHAELLALRDAARVVGPYLTECTLVVTLEPCPMCLGAALEARVGCIVYGASNPRAGALGGVHDLLTSGWGHRPDVRGGVRAAEAARLLRDLFADVRAARTSPRPEQDT